MEGARHFAVALGAGAFKLPTVADLVRAIADAGLETEALSDEFLVRTAETLYLARRELTAKGGRAKDREDMGVGRKGQWLW